MGLSLHNCYMLQIYSLERNINTTVTQGIESLRRVYQNYPAHSNEAGRLHDELQLKTDDSFSYAKQILHNVAIVNQRAKKINIDRLVRYVEEYGFYRFVAWLLSI